ncbi:MAG: TatD family hydrolase, partial [Elusimicrobiota bacterium]
MPEIRLVDAHNHLQNYPGEKETAGALARASAAGVSLMLCNGTRPDDWAKVLSLAARPDIVPFFGLHPWFVDKAPAGWLELLGDFLRRAPSGVGEIGLDKAVDADLGRQEEAFKAQLRLAKKLGRPVCIHCVRAWGRMLEILKEEQPPVFLFHAYGGPPELMKELSDLGGWFSFGTGLLDPVREKLRKALMAAPPWKLLLETEAPESGSGPGELPGVIQAAAS